MSFADYVKKENQRSRTETSQLTRMAILSLIAGVLSGLILTGSGCNSAIQLANGIGKDMQVGGAGIQSMTDKQRDIGAFSFKSVDSMILDQEGF